MHNCVRHYQRCLALHKFNGYVQVCVSLCTHASYWITAAVAFLSILPDTCATAALNQSSTAETLFARAGLSRTQHLPLPQVRTTPAEIMDYFDHFLLNKPQGVIDESHVHLWSSTLAGRDGIYTFSLNRAGSSQRSRPDSASSIARKTGCGRLRSTTPPPCLSKSCPPTRRSAILPSAGALCAIAFMLKVLAHWIL
jgi:hypothetical protein